MTRDQVKRVAQSFHNEIQNAHTQKAPSSLPFIVHTLPDHPLVEPGKLFQVLVIGGTIYQSAICQFDIRKKIIISDHKTGDKPVFNTKSDFIFFIEQMLDPEIDTLAINFAYPLDPYYDGSKLDGKLVMAMKENAFEGMIGHSIGKEVEKHYAENHKRSIQVTVANDTICTLLSGIHAYDPNKLACGIVGTGMNFAFFLDNHHPVNLESANFDKFEQSKTGKVVDSRSSRPGKSTFEKEISGAYLYQHFNAYAELNQLTDHIDSTKELDMFAQTCNQGSTICDFTAELVGRASGLVAAQIAGITMFKQSDMTFIMAGSLFWKAWQFKEQVTAHVAAVVPEYKIEFTPIRNCELTGAANLLR